MANEWISLLKGAPTNNMNLVNTFQDSQAKAIENKKNAYDLYRTQKAQEIVGSSTDAEGNINWDNVFKSGVKAGLGLDAFKQTHAMQLERRAAELQQLQNRRFLESMGYDPTRWDSSAGPNVQVPAGNVPYEGPSQNNYDFITQPQETQIPQAQNPAFGANGVGETAQTPMAPSVQAPSNAQDVVVQGNVGPASKTPMYELPTPAMRDPNAPSAVQEGYYNELWRQKGIPEGQDVMGGAGGANGVGGLQLSTAQMKPAEIDNLNRYLALRGIYVSGQEGLSALEKMAVSSVPMPVMNPMAMMSGKEEYAKEMGRFTTAMAEYPAKVQEARNKLSDAIRGGNWEVFDKDLQKQGNERAIEKQDYDLAGQKTGIFARKVSEPEARVVKLQRTSINDIIAAPDSFAGAYQAAVAKAKSDGSVNQDAIISNLVAMEALPSSDAIYLKALMNTDGSLTSAGKKWITNALVGQRGPSSTWKQNAIDNINQYIIDNGGRAVDWKPASTSTPVTSPTPKPTSKPVKKAPVTKKDPLGLGF